jgi:hypothetical protein
MTTDRRPLSRVRHVLVRRRCPVRHHPPGRAAAVRGAEVSEQQLSPDALAFGDQAEAEILRRGLAYAGANLSDAGLGMDDLSEDERMILRLGIRAGAMAHLAWAADS